ncbi:hypothetical protein SCP_0210450 [Sparassis crispa]|uniref:Uncharacterized protein n=1 Tax=Sparassis crispa TaxID=139825 RepID=A0A401GCE9_9APHY|nr:hypothetical protein SCP_0210450 [Sparassis crispa]GBE79844.1 hypothetical protein SCP_0210450 [Sparassis crispa]
MITPARLATQRYRSLWISFHLTMNMPDFLRFSIILRPCTHSAIIERACKTTLFLTYFRRCAIPDPSKGAGSVKLHTVGSEPHTMGSTNVTLIPFKTVSEEAETFILT